MSDQKLAKAYDEAMENIIKLEDALRAALLREQEWARIHGTGDHCCCIGLSREAEQEYETGQCPHQRAWAVLGETP